MRSKLVAHHTTRLFVAFVLIATATQSAAQQATRVFAVMGIPAEIAPVEARLEGTTVNRIQDIVCTSGMFAGAHVVAIRSGVGKVNAAMAATLVLNQLKPFAVMVSGTAGAIATNWEPGDVVIGTGVG
jgi:adenosylhomocysteine nucleosidase